MNLALLSVSFKLLNCDPIFQHFFVSIFIIFGSCNPVLILSVSFSDASTFLIMFNLFSNGSKSIILPIISSRCFASFYIFINTKVKFRVKKQTQI